MPRVIGIDPGTVSLDLFGLDDGRVFLDRTLKTSEALADPAAVLDLLGRAHRERPLDLIAGPSGYGLPMVALRDLTDRDLRLAYLGGAGEPGGIGGLRAFVRALQQSPLAAHVPVLFTPGVIHLPTVPVYRKANRIDMGTADKVAAVALALSEETRKYETPAEAPSFILLELGGAFSAALAVQRGCIVDGLGGASGPVGGRSAGGWDGEVAFLAGSVPKAMLFEGGVEAVAGGGRPALEILASPRTEAEKGASELFVEQLLKAVAALAVSAPEAGKVVLSGRLSGVVEVRRALADRVAPGWSVTVLDGFGEGTTAARGVLASQAAQGAAVLADGLAGGSSAPIVEALRVREARGTVLDYLYVLSRETALARLGVDG